MTSENQRVPGEHPTAQLAWLRKQGMTVKQAAETVGVSERHAYRLLENFDERPLMFERWSPSMADRRDPPEKIEWLFETYMDAAWWVEDAEIAWSIHCADGEIEPWIIKAFCRLYVAANQTDPATRIRNRMIIDWALWHRIWETADQVWEFAQSMPVFTSEEFDFASEVSHYLSMYAPGDLDLAGLDTEAQSKPRIQTVISGVADRWDYFKNALERIAKDEERVIRETSPGKLPTIAVPGEFKRPARRRKQR
jgi:hypothetical protein